VVDIAAGVVGESVITAHEEAVDGMVEHREADQITATMDELRDGDMVLSRINAPLMGHALRLIRQGRKAVVRGRDIGRELSNLVKRFRAVTIEDMVTKLEEWRAIEVQKYQKMDNNAGVTRTEDKANTIYAVAENLSGSDRTVNGLILTLENIFSDDVVGVVFSSIHRAKGLESDRVVIIEPHLLPHPRAKTTAAKQQEVNLQYVAYTRAIDTLIIQQTKQTKSRP